MLHPVQSMRGSRKFCLRGSNFDVVFCVLFFVFVFFSLMRGGRIQIPLLAGHQRPPSEMPFILNGVLLAG